ncbi:hypothetical protein KSP35_11310 [Aquihabitans sp. G128]|uniref:hypothetical protein n=1 Tax=Aquihabitans sp. G128 TaxID=2849779 RepID=UPI001C217654|nr:hypothetical protein [Aquihabitans sp. G128]QXC63316.1 hypothetical protein KSP35_11310 [Aquihabitans sp. G128]
MSVGTDGHPVVLDGLPVILFDTAVTYLADTLRECQLVLVDVAQGQEAGSDLAGLAAGLVPDLEELRDLFRAAAITTDGKTYRVEVPMRTADAGTLAHLQMQLVQLRYLGRLGNLLISSDPEITQFLAWIWDEAADQLNGRAGRPYRPL